MDTRQKAFRFIVLIPHRDALLPFKLCRSKLFAGGFFGAYSFPLAAPLASVSRGFNREELKELARNIRNLTKNHNGKIQCEKTALQDNSCGFPASFFGPELNLEINEGTFPGTATDKITQIFSPTVLCISLIDPNLETFAPLRLCVKNKEEIPILSFRQAALANLAIRPLTAGAFPYSFEWKISPLVWLPKVNMGLPGLEPGTNRL